MPQHENLRRFPVILDHRVIQYDREALKAVIIPARHINRQVALLMIISSQCRIQDGQCKEE
jgi:hypothetical protein